MEVSNKKVQAIRKLYEVNGKLLKDLCVRADASYRDYFPRKDLAETGIDLVQGIICAMLMGDRSWDVEKYPDAYNQVLYYLRSELTNLKSKELKMINSLDITSQEVLDTELINNVTKVFPDENLEQKEIKEMYKKCLKYIKEKGSVLQATVFEGMYYRKTNKELALENSVKVKEIENAKKQIKVRLHEKFPEYRIKY